MFGFGKKKDKNTDNEELIIYNLDDEPVFNKMTGEFLQDFDYEQKKYLRLFIDHKVSVITFAYATLPWEFYKLIQEHILPFNGEKYLYNNFDEAILYRIVHTNMTLDKFSDCLDAMMVGVDMCKQIREIGRYPREILNIVSSVAVNYGADLCSEISPDMDVDEFMLKVDKVRMKHKKKDDKIEREARMISRITRF